MTLETF